MPLSLEETMLAEIQDLREQLNAKKDFIKHLSENPNLVTRLFLDGSLALISVDKLAEIHDKINSRL